MRLLLKLRVANNFSYDMKYYSKFQGFIYRELIDTPYRFLHEKKGYKFFCFSNTFPLKKSKDNNIAPFKENERKYWLISSPDTGFVYVLNKKLEKIKEENKIINFGEMQFYLEGIKDLKVKIRNKLKLKIETPIILRISKKTYEMYGVKPPKEYKYLFWRQKWPFELFSKNLTNNLLNKYKEFYQIKDKEFNKFKEKILPLFQRFEFVKAVVNHVLINGVEQKFIGTLWNFYFDWLNEEQRKLLEFAMDCGFGEKNSYGFGFVNKNY